MTQSTETAGTPAAAGPATAAEPPVAPGTILAGKYRVERVIGQGGMGVVVEARHIALDDRVALKFLTSSFARHPEAMARFHREGKAAVKIKSEHVARVSDIGTLENGAPYMVMEFLQGRDLSQELQVRGVFSVEDATDYVIQACEAIGEAHSHGIVHRDIKPANLFLSRRHDGSALVKVLDFGISKMAEGVENLTGTMTAMGSALYMSPEQMQQSRGVDHRTDIYALGIALYELLAGKQPYYAETLPQLCAEVLTGVPTPLRQVRPDIPAELGPVLEKAYARDRAHRYATVAELVIALAPFAPSRTQPNIDRIARSAGQPPPIAGAPAPHAAMGDPLLTGGTIAMDAPRSPLAGFPDPGTGPGRPPHNSYPMAGGPGAQATPAGGYPAPGPAYPGGPGAITGHPAPGYSTSPPGQGPRPPGYATTPPGGHPAGPPGYGTTPPGYPGGGPGAPVVGPGTAPNMVLATPSPGPAPSASKAPLVIGIGVALVGLAVAGFFAFRGAPPPEPATTAAPADTSAEPATTAAPSTAPVTPTAPTARPATTPAEPETPPTATADTPSATSTAQPVTRPPLKVVPVTKPTAAPKPTVTKPKSVFSER